MPTPIESSIDSTLKFVREFSIIRGADVICLILQNNFERKRYYSQQFKIQFQPAPSASEIDKCVLVTDIALWLCDFLLAAFGRNRGRVGSLFGRVI
jgi:hypothetical protein